MGVRVCPLLQLIAMSLPELSDFGSLEEPIDERLLIRYSVSA